VLEVEHKGPNQCGDPLVEKVVIQKATVQEKHPQTFPKLPLTPVEMIGEKVLQ